MKMSLKYLIRFCVSICFFHFQCSSAVGQDQRVADSLVKIYEENKLVGPEKLELLRNLSFNEVNDLESSLRYAEELITLSKQEENYLYLYRGYLQKGRINRLTGEFEKALAAFFDSYEAAAKAGFLEGEGSVYLSIADTYSEIGNSGNAEIYYDKGIQLLRKTGDSITLGTALLNAGDEYFGNEKYDLAKAYFDEAGLIFRDADYLSGWAYSAGNLGMLYAKQGLHDLAKSNINEAIEILERFGDCYPISEYLNYMSDI